MRATLTIAEREIRAYFTSPIGFVVLWATGNLGNLLAGTIIVLKRRHAQRLEA